jgi:hypothetical protein
MLFRGDHVLFHAGNRREIEVSPVFGGRRTPASYLPRDEVGVATFDRRPAGLRKNGFGMCGGESRRRIDDIDTTYISWPNYHSGSNGNYQKVAAVKPVHELLQNPHNSSGVIEYFPAHPHEGAVGVPEDEVHAEVIATGMSTVTDRPFNLIVAFERSRDDHGNRLGRAVAESSFHHLVDYNWDTSTGCPSFLEEPPGEEIIREPERLEDIRPM